MSIGQERRNRPGISFLFKYCNLYLFLYLAFMERQNSGIFLVLPGLGDLRVKTCWEWVCHLLSRADYRNKISLETGTLLEPQQSFTFCTCSPLSHHPLTQFFAIWIWHTAYHTLMTRGIECRIFNFSVAFRTIHTFTDIVIFQELSAASGLTGHPILLKFILFWLLGSSLTFVIPSLHFP